MEECDSLDSEVTEFPCEASEAASQDDDDEVEELQNSLREAVQDPTVKPKFQCLMVDPSFSMVTVQSEDSGIVWETASSRCSTPWASDTSSISEAYSMDGSGAAGKITIVFDEEKVARRRIRSGGRSSRLADRLSRPGSSRSASALGVERLEMREVSVPNIAEEKSEAEPDLEKIKNKDQQLFSLISEGYEILNIRVPTKLPTVDEEESTELQDNLSYLDQTPKIKSRNQEWTQPQNHVLQDEETPARQEPPEQQSSQPSADTELRRALTENDGANDIDYFEKFTLVDVVGPGEQALEDRETGQLAAKVATEEPKPAKETAEDSLPASEDSFVIVSDVDIVGEHLDEVFYGEGAPADALQHREFEAACGAGMRSRRESQRSAKESGSVLFETEETTLTPIYISPGPPKIIDPILLEEPTAMSFMYSDLYEDAVGERRKSDEEHSESESVASEKVSKRRLSDSEEADGYLEKFILKDETPTVEVPPETVEDGREGRMMWAQSKFEMTGCLARVPKDGDELRRKMEETKEQDINVRDREEDPGAAVVEERAEQMTEKIEKESKREKSIRESIVGDETVKCEVRKDQTENSESSTGQAPLTPQAISCKDEKREHQREEQAASIHSDLLPQTQEIMEQDVIKGTEEGIGAEPGEAAAGAEAVVTTQNLYSGQEPAAVPATEHSAESSPPEGKEAAAFRNVEVPSECGARAFVEVNDKPVNKGEIQSEVHADFQEAGNTEGRGDQTAGETCDAQSLEQEILMEVERETEGHGESIASKPATSEEAGRCSERNLCESKPRPEEESATAGTPTAQTRLIPEGKKEKTTDDGGRSVQKKKAAEDFVLLVPKGQAVEMDIEISHVPEVTTDDSKCRDLTPPCVTMDTAIPQLPDDGTEPQLEVKPSDGHEEKTHFSPPAPTEDSISDQEKVEREQYEGVSPSLRSFTAQEDLSGLLVEDTEGKHEGEEVETSEVGDITEGPVDEERPSPETKEGKMEPEEVAPESPDVNAEELDYEVISEQEAKEMCEEEPQRDAEEPEPEPEKGSFDLSPEEEHIEDDYEIFDAEEERQARLAAELQGLDWFCFTCGDLLSKDDRTSEEHRNHNVTDVDAAYEEIKEKLSDWISELQERSENVEDLVSELELAYNSVEEQCTETEAAVQAQNEEMMALVMEQYNDMSVSMEEEKKAKLEQIYDQIVSFQENVGSAKATLETTAREAETEARTPEDIHARLKAALDSATSLELGPKVLMLFEDYAKGNTSSSHLACRGVPVPQRPRLQPQEMGSATSTSVTVYWRVSPGDVIDCFQVYCMEDPHGVVSEEYRVTVKESYCVLEELEPDKVYKVWVMAVNYTGCSLPSDKLAFRTAPSVPVIDTEHCTVMWDSATLRWSSSEQLPEQSYILEYCRQYELEGEGLRSISGIRSCEQKVLLQPEENYLFYIKAVNEAGTSEQSEAALISTKGTKFQLLKDSAHPALELSVDQTTLHYCDDAPGNAVPADGECPSILGELLLPRGRYYWETIVSRSTAYRLGVAYSKASRSSPLGENRLSWCLQCVPTMSGCRYQLLHINIQSSLFVTETPERVGTLLDYQLGRLSFYNAQSGQLLGTFCQQFTQPCHPALALEMPGSLEVSMVLKMPDFIKNS
ncbi:LOW QUALITY PROTEIN: cardiomyopathy-associated protein 5 [Takifugu flavidus]|uniref:LOW QUALITY PROTEIN: cardiomyopathy-associated protein 5 n=1 Tax=Takifugu flavidus TaxID=433684 RepID=UPI002544B31E|nr:LOW QUALITY PROTEIN: cardiomyopathy-associated protein 5 [Takifugu flavidus]